MVKLYCLKEIDRWIDSYRWREREREREKERERETERETERARGRGRGHDIFEKILEHLADKYQINDY